MEKIKESIATDEVTELKEVKEEDKTIIAKSIGENTVDDTVEQESESDTKEIVQDEKQKPILFDSDSVVSVNNRSYTSKEKEEDAEKTCTIEEPKDTERVRKDFPAEELSEYIDTEKEAIIEELLEGTETEKEGIKSTDIGIKDIEDEVSADTEKENIDVNLKENLDESINENKASTTDVKTIVEEIEENNEIREDDRMVCDDIIKSSESIISTVPEDVVTDTLDFFTEDISMQDELIEKMDISVEDTYIEKINVEENIPDTVVKGTMDIPVSNKIFDNRENRVDDSIKNGCVNTQ